MFYPFYAKRCLFYVLSIRKIFYINVHVSVFSENGSEDIHLLSNGLAFISSVCIDKTIAFCVICHIDSFLLICINFMKNHTLYALRRTLRIASAKHATNHLDCGYGFGNITWMTIDEFPSRPVYHRNRLIVIGIMLFSNPPDCLHK